MKKVMLIIFLIINFSNVFGQRENSFAHKIFNSDKYQQKHYPRFDEEIIKFDDGAFKFGDKHFKVSVESPEFINIFELGIFNPNIIFGKETSKMSNNEFDQLTESQKILYNLERNDSIFICCVKELKSLNPNAQTKRFVFWRLREKILNPTEYYFELYNSKATNETEMNNFIINSTMTFISEGIGIM